MDAKTLQQFESELVDEFFVRLNQQPAQPRQIAAPQSEPARPYYRGPSQSVIERQKIEDQLHSLVEASTARLYKMLMARLDEMKAEQQARQVEAEQQRRAMQRISAPCTPSRNSCY